MIWTRTLVSRAWQKTGSCPRTLDGHTDAVTSVSISPDGKSVLSSSLDGTVRSV